MQPSDLEPPPYGPGSDRPGWELPGPGPAQWWQPRRGPRRPVRRTVTVTLVTFAVVTALGVPLGLLWRWLAPGVPVVDVGDSGIVVNDPSPEQYIAADGWFTLLGIAFGVLVAIAAWLVVRRDRGPFLLLGVVAGTVVAGHWVAPWIGEMIGRDAYEQWRTSAAQGATYLAPPEVHSLGPTLVPAFAAAIVLTLLAGWSNDPDLDQPGAAPGYGPNHPPYDARAGFQDPGSRDAAFQDPAVERASGFQDPAGRDAAFQDPAVERASAFQDPAGRDAAFQDPAVERASAFQDPARRDRAFQDSAGRDSAFQDRAAGRASGGAQGPGGSDDSVGAGGPGEVGQRDGDGADPRQQA